MPTLPKLDTIIAIAAEPEAKQRRKGIIAPRKPDEAWRRRINREIFVRYFDPAQLADGTERPFFYDPGFTPLGDASPWNIARGTLCPYPPFTDTDGFLDDFNSYFLDGDRDEWAETYREAKADETPQFFAIGVGNAYQEGRGYPVGDSENASNAYSLRYGDGGFEQLWRNFDTLTFKVTREPLYADDAVTFVLDASCDVFLSPSARFWEGRAASWEPIAFPFPSGPYYRRVRFYLLNHFLRTIPRSFAIDNALYQDWWERCSWPDHPIAPCAGNWPVSRALPQYLREAFYDLFTGLSESRSTTINVDAWSADGLSNDPNSYVEAGGFPNSYDSSGLIFDGGLGLDTNHSWMDDPMVRWFTWYRPEGLLSAVINKKGGSDAGWYYVWRSEADTVDNPYGSTSFPTIASFGGADKGAMV